MKVRICYTVEVDDHFLRAVNHWFGEDGMASREDIKRWCRQFGESNSDDVLSHYQKTLEAERSMENEYNEDIEYCENPVCQKELEEGRIGYCDDCPDAGYGDEDEDGSGSPLTADTHEA